MNASIAASGASCGGSSLGAGIAKCGFERIEYRLNHTVPHMLFSLDHADGAHGRLRRHGQHAQGGVALPARPAQARHQRHPHLLAHQLDNRLD